MAICAQPAAWCAGSDYLKNVSAALDQLQAGKTRESLAYVRSALTTNATDPLAHTVMGLTLAMGGRQSDAWAEFAVARGLDPACAEAAYGQGVLKLAKGDLATATGLFGKAAELDSLLGAQEAIAYAKLTAGAAEANESTGAAARAVNAMALMKQGRFAEAKAVWMELVARTKPPGFGDRIGWSLTFVPAKPIAAAGWPLKEGYAPLAKAAAGKKGVSGKVTLRADLSRASSVRILSFFVDGQLVGITNQPPFALTWDTTTVANGQHTVKIIGTDASDATVSEKTATVMVYNQGPRSVVQRVTGPEAEAVWGELRELLIAKPSAAAMNYHLALCCLKLDESDQAIAAFERVMAANPGYMDAAERLGKLCRARSQSSTIYSVPSAKKLIALTFDDGPKAETPQLLSVLRDKGVKATFFVVGKQVDLYPDILRQLAADGHEVENHTYNHRALDFLSTPDIEQEYFATAAAVRSVTGKSTSYLRPPGGRHGKKLQDVAGKYGLHTVFWTANCTSFEGTTPQKVLKYVLSSAKPGAIVLMHNLDKVTLAALPSVIDALRGKGYTLVTLDEMVQQSRSN